MTWTFHKQRRKEGYINNPWWTLTPTDRHFPCGYWDVLGGPDTGLYFAGDNTGFSVSDMPPRGWPNCTKWRGKFVGNLRNFGTESFESFNHLDVFSPTPRAINFGGYVNATMYGNVGVMDWNEHFHPRRPSDGRFPTTGDKYIATSDLSGFQITFEESIAAFGMFVIDIGDFGGDLSITLVYDSGAPYTIDLPEFSTLYNSNIAWFGVFDISRNVVAVRMSKTSIADAFAFDDMIVAKRSDVKRDNTLATYDVVNSEPWIDTQYCSRTAIQTQSENFRMVVPYSEFLSVPNLWDQARLYFLQTSSGGYDFKISGASIGVRDGDTINFASAPSRVQFFWDNELIIPDGAAEAVLSDWADIDISVGDDLLVHIFVEHNGTDTIRTSDDRPSPRHWDSYRKVTNDDETMVQEVTGYSAASRGYFVDGIIARNSSLY